LEQLKRLSYSLKEPVAVIERGNEPYLVVPDKVAVLPATYNLVRTVAHLQPQEETFELDYTLRSPENDDICLRFLSFYIKNPLFNDPRLWSPASGRPFFERIPVNTVLGVQRYKGFIARPMILRDGGIGFCVDTSICYVSSNALPAKLNRDEFNRSWKGRNFIYHFGDQWHQVKLTDFGDMDVSRHQFVIDGKMHSLHGYIMEKARKPIAAELASLPHDGSVVMYRDSRGMEKSAPAALCYPVIDTEAPGAKERHGETILPPHIRRQMILEFVSKYMTRLSFGSSTLSIDMSPKTIDARVFSVPDQVFGNGVVLSTNGTAGARKTTVKEIGKARAELLRDRSAGFYVSAPLDQQYFILPRSIHDSCGTQFLADLREQVNNMFPQPQGYDPIVIVYDDTGKKTFSAQALALRKAFGLAKLTFGYAVVMIHRTTDRAARKEDPLAAMVTRELIEQYDLRVGVIHTDMARRCYKEIQLPDGSRKYQSDDAMRGRLSGYLKNVALNQVLLTNQRWPFILGDRLHADVTIGIDIKQNTCGLLVVNENASRVFFLAKTSRQKERLLDEQMASYLTEVLREEARNLGKVFEKIVIHRDGRAFQSELTGIDMAIEILKKDGVVSQNVAVAVLEIPETSPVSLRFFDVEGGTSNPHIKNPSIGTYYITGERDGYLCATGREFPRKGTVHPLHVKKVSGKIPLEVCLEDLYKLTTLAWTRPEDCTREPITIKLNDRFLFDEAGLYDAQQLEYAEILGQGAWHEPCGCCFRLV
jgi:hypothetical protein